MSIEKVRYCFLHYSGRNSKIFGTVVLTVYSTNYMHTVKYHITSSTCITVVYGSLNIYDLTSLFMYTYFYWSTASELFVLQVNPLRIIFVFEFFVFESLWKGTSTVILNSVYYYSTLQLCHFYGLRRRL
jgi:hypothetical protein